ncbi:MAG: exodeoxyribonuclease III [Rickettsiales bacterium]|jgi:exodeoxyribonuclease-3|nr:exodeoxyribonuclease III [Rickettsiales bacterium]
MIKILTWNVNSVRRRIPNLINLAIAENPDVILLQELKCVQEQFPFLELDCLNYNIEIVGQKGRNGVAILSKFPLYDVRRGLPLYGIRDEDSEGRYVEARIDCGSMSIKIASAYAPNGGPSAFDVKQGMEDITDTETFSNKMKFFDRLKLKFLEETNSGEATFFGGDYNVCPNLFMDVYSPKKDGSITCTEKERIKFRELLAVGMADIWRELNPELKEYTWWGYRPTTMFENNQGYRIDAILTTPMAKMLVKECKILKSVRGEEKPSDHVPMICAVNC